MNEEIQDTRLKSIVAATIIFMALAFVVLAIAVSPNPLDLKFALTGLLLLCVAVVYGLFFAVDWTVET